MAGGNGLGRDDAFYARVLSGIGAPVNQTNLAVLRAWQKAEGGSASWNPFNTTAKAPGATAYNNNNGYPVRNYTSEAQGVDATVRTLKLGYYKVIVAGLRNSNPITAIAGIVASPWDGHYGATKSAGGWNFRTSHVYKIWASNGGAATSGSTASKDLPAGLKSGTGTGGVAHYDPEPPYALIDPDGKIWVPWNLWVAQVPAEKRKTIAIVSDPGAYKRAGDSKDPGGVTDVGVQAVDDVLSPLDGVLTWFSDNMARIGLALLGVLILIFGIIYANKGTIKETVGVAAKVAAVA